VVERVVVKIHTAFWPAVTLSLVALDLLGWEVAATAVLVVAILAELRGGLNKHADDTWSEWVWSMIGGRPALIPVTIGFAVWLPWQFLELAPGGGSVVEAVGWDLGLGTLAAGTALTLAAHFIFRGRFG